MAETERIANRESMVTLAALQFEPRIGYKAENVEHSVRLLHAAADQGADFAVLPEMCNTGYVFNSREELYGVAEKIPDGATVKAWERVARERGIHIVAGIGELDDDGVRCYNSSVLIGPGGHIGTHRKFNLWGEDKYFFEPGNLGFQVFQTPVGRVGMLVCYDMWFFENFRILSMMGADLVCCPTNWIDAAPREPRTLGPNLCLANAGCNRVFVVAADRTGVERGMKFPGLSCIAGPEGGYRAGPAGDAGEEVVLATVNLAQARRKNWNKTNCVHSDRRVDLYDEMLGSGKPRFHC